MHVYTARLSRIVDADTWIFDIDLGCWTWIHARRIRASGLNAPELSTDEGRAALAYVNDWFAAHAPDGMVLLRTERDRSDNFGRLLGTVIADDGHILNDDLLFSGHAVRY
jgi:endonuclease YncB( thermonuclease family)